MRAGGENRRSSRCLPTGLRQGVCCLITQLGVLCNLGVVGAWYSIGILAGLGTAIGVALTSTLRRARPALVTAAVVSVVIGFAFSGWAQAAGGLAGACCGVLGSAPLVAGALRRGGTRGGTA